MLSRSSHNQIKFAYKDYYNSSISLGTFDVDLLLTLSAISAKILKFLFLANEEGRGGTGHKGQGGRLHEGSVMVV